MKTECKITGETDMGRPVAAKKKTSIVNKNWIVLAGGLFLTSLTGGFVGSWLNKSEESQLSSVADKLIVGIEKLIPAIDKLDTKDRIDEVLSAIDNLDKKLDSSTPVVIPDKTFHVMTPVICVNRSGKTQCIPPLAKAVSVSLGHVKECALINVELRCEKEERLR